MENQILEILQEIQKDVKNIIQEQKQQKELVDGLIELHGETQSDIKLIQKEIKFIGHKLQDSEKEIFLVREELKVVK